MKHIRLPLQIDCYKSKSGYVLIRDKNNAPLSYVYDFSDKLGDEQLVERKAEFIVRACNSHYELVEAAENMLKHSGNTKYWVALRQAISKATGKEV